MNTTSYLSFDDTVTHAMGVAFDKACKSLSYFGVAMTARTFVALRIIEAAQAGERDPERLYEAGLKGIGHRPCVDADGSVDRERSQPPHRSMLRSRSDCVVNESPASP
jgi:hypothetical protein